MTSRTPARPPLGPAILCLAALVSAPGRAQVSVPPTFPSRVEMITVDAVVLDARGQPVPGLTRDDFVVKEDGRAREIVSFEAFVAGASTEEPEPAETVAASNDPAAGRTGRAFAIVVDDLRVTPERMGPARDAALTFLKRYVRDGDRVALATTSGDAWWSARIPDGREDLLAVLARVRGRSADLAVVDRMTDYEAYWIANHEDSPGATRVTPGTNVSIPGAGSSQSIDLPPPGGLKERVKQRWEQANLCVPPFCDGIVRDRAAEIDTRRRARTQMTLQRVRRAIEALAPVHGRKSLLLLSEGFLQDPGSELRAVVAASREANTAVYFVDVRGLLAIPGFGSAADAGPPPDPRDLAAESFEESSIETGGAEALADETGGFSVRRTNDLSSAAWKVAAESRVFYLLGFYPPEGKSDRDWRSLRVELKRPGLTVRARRGYTLRSEMAVAQPARETKADGKKTGVKAPTLDPLVARALDAVDQAPGIPLRAIVYVLEPRSKDTVHVQLVLELDASRLAVQSGGTARSLRLELSALAVQRDSGREFRHDGAVEVAVAEGTAPGWRGVTKEFELPAGVCQMRVVVRDPQSGALGSLSQRFEVPAAGGGLRLSTPILTNRIEPPSSPGDRPRPALAAHRVFPPGGGLYCQFEVFGAARPSNREAGRVSVGIEVRTEDGRVVRSAPATAIAADGGGRLVRTAGFGLDGLAEGAYDLVLDVQDLVSKARLEDRERFVLARDGGGR